MLTLLCGVGWPARASADEYDCSQGGEQVSTTGVMNLIEDSTGRGVWLEAWTARSLEDKQNCPGWVRVEGWISGDPSGAQTDQGHVVAALGGCQSCVGPLMVIPCTAGTYTGNTKHWWIKDGWFGDPWTSLGNKTPTITAAECDVPPEECTTDCEAYDDGTNTPLLVDTAGDGFRLTGAPDGVWFDLDGDGIQELVAWTLPNSDDGWLAMDRNRNGQIDSGQELFGNRTPAYGGQSKPTTANGFLALAFLESPFYGVSVFDQVIDARDAAYGLLLVWTDRNHNGLSEPEELQPLAKIGLSAVETSYKESKRRDQFGNEYRLRSIGWWTKEEQPERGACQEFRVWGLA